MMYLLSAHFTDRCKIVYTFPGYSIAPSPPPRRPPNPTMHRALS